MATENPRGPQPPSHSDDLSLEELEDVAGGMMDTNNSGCVEINVIACPPSAT